MLGSLLRVPPGEAVDVTIVDRRTGKERTVTIAPFEISATIVTVEDWNAVMEQPSSTTPGGGCRWWRFPGVRPSSSAMSCRDVPV